MKKIGTLTLFCSLLITTYGQTWIDKGAEWHFGYGGMQDVGFIKVKYTMDTLIEGRLCQKLEQFQYRFTVNPSHEWIFLGVLPLKQEYTYLSGDTVFYYKDNRFNVLYNFGAQPGDSWDLGIDTNHWKCSKSIIEVDSVKTIVINNITYRCIHVKPQLNASGYLKGWIIEKFGSFENYLFPIENVCDTNVIFEGVDIKFSCYKDTSFPLLNVTNKNCEYYFQLVSISELHTPEVSVSPNPVLDKLIISFNEKNPVLYVIVYDINGKQLGIYYSSTVNFKEYETGMYCMKIVLTNREIIHRKIIKN